MSKKSIDSYFENKASKNYMVFGSVISSKEGDRHQFNASFVKAEGESLKFEEVKLKWVTDEGKERNEIMPVISMELTSVGDNKLTIRKKVPINEELEFLIEGGEMADTYGVSSVGKLSKSENLYDSFSFRRDKYE